MGICITVVTREQSSLQVQLVDSQQRNSVRSLPLPPSLHLRDYLEISEQQSVPIMQDSWPGPVRLLLLSGDTNERTVDQGLRASELAKTSAPNMR